MVKKLSKIVNSPNTFAGKMFALFFQGLILLSLILFSFETVPSLSIYKSFFDWSEVVIVILFTIEYVLRFITSEHRWRYPFQLASIIDLLAILPFYLTFGAADFRVIRIFRLFRIIRVLKLARYSRALQRFVDAFREIKNELVIFVMAATFILYLSAVGIYFFEHQAQPEQFQSIIHSLWWAVGTLTTVGYGDVYPITIGGKIFTFVILIIGLGFISVPSALLASAFSKIEKE